MTEEEAVSAAEIDLDELPDLVERLCSWRDFEKTGCNHDVLVEAIAAVEALRERVAELTEPHDGPCHYCSRTTNSLAGNPSEWPLMFCHEEDPGRSKHHHVGCVTKKLRSAEAAEARETELAGALNDVAEFMEDLRGSNPAVLGCQCEAEKARTTLAATPTEALERARARDEVVRWAKEMCGESGAIRPYAFEELEKALAKLDALESPKGSGT